MKLSVLVTLSLIGASLGAQSSLRAELRTATDFGTYASDGTTTKLNRVATNTQLRPNTSLSYGALVRGGSMTTILFHAVRSGVASVDFSHQGGGSPQGRLGFAGGTTSSPTTNGLRQGPHSLLWRLQGPAGSRALLRLNALTGTSTNSSTGVTVTYSVDVGNDRSVDYRFAYPRQQSSGDMLTVRFDRSGRLDVRLTADVRVVIASNKSQLFKAGLSAVLQPAPACWALAYPVDTRTCTTFLSVLPKHDARGQSLTVNVSSAPANSSGLAVIGDRRINLPLPTTRCPLTTNILVAVPFNTDARGRATRTVALGQAPGFDINLQAAVFTRTRLFPTGAVRVRCIR